MTELGPLKLTLVAHTKRFNSSIRTATTNLVKFRDTIKPIAGALKSLAGSTKPAAHSMMNLTNTTKAMANMGYKGAGGIKALSASMERQRKALQKVVGPAMQVGISYKQMAGAGIKAALTLRAATEQSFGATIKSMLKFRAMMAKIVHYVTFSIGVQMVMMFRRGFEQLIEIFSDFERAAVNAACYDEKTEVLTEDGWKPWPSVSHEDKFATLNPKTFELEYHYPSFVNKQFYSGKMYHIKTGRIDLMVTPNHKMFVKRRHSNEFELIQAQDIIGEQVAYNKYAKWEGTNPKYFKIKPMLYSKKYYQRTINRDSETGKIISSKIIPNSDITKTVDIPEKSILMEDWLELFGIWIAEGSLADDDKGNYEIVITNFNKSTREKIFSVMERISGKQKVRHDRGNIVFQNKQIWNYLKQFGYAWEKYLPKDIKNLSPRLLKIFFESYMLGDGSKRGRTCTTTSKRLRDDLEEIILKIGWSASHYKKKDHISFIEGRKITAKHDCWNININRKQLTPSYWPYNHNKSVVEEMVDYKGGIFCVEVPYHTLFVRRNGKSVWSGNTISGYLGSSFERVKKHIMDVSRTLGRETVYSATQVADSFYSIASAGYDVSKMLSKDLLPMLDYAAATQADLTEATTAVLVTLKQFNMEMSETGHIVDVFTTAITSSFMTMEKMKESMKYAGPIAGILGQSFESIAAATSILVDRGLEAGQSGQRLNMVLVKLLKPTEKGRKSLEAMGYNMEDLTPLGNSLIEVLYRLQAGGAGAAQMAEIFRARTAGAAAVLVEEAQAIARMTTRLEMAEGITKSVADAQEDTLWGALTKTSNRMTEVATRIGEDLAPILIYIANIIHKSLAPVLEGLGSIFGFISKHGLFFKNVLSLLTTYLTMYIVRTKILIPLTLMLKNAQILTTLAIYKKIVALKIANIVKWKSIAVTKGLIAANAALNVSFKSLAITMLMSPITWFAIAIGIAAFAIAGMVGEATKLSEVEIKARKEMTNFQEALLEFDISALEETSEQIGEMEHAWQRHEKMIIKQKMAYKVLGMMRESATEYKDELDAIAQSAGFANAESVNWGVNVLGLYPEMVDVIGEIAISEKLAAQGILTKVRAQIHLNEALGKYEIALYLLDKANKQLVKSQEDFNSGIGDTLDLYAELTKAEEKYADAQSELIKYTGKLLSAIRELPGYMEDFIQVLENAYDAKSGYITKTEHLLRLEDDEIEALDDLTDARLRYGSASKEAARAEDKLRNAVQAKIDVEMESIELDKQYEQGIDLVQKAIDGYAVSLSDVEESMVTLNDAEQALLSHSMAIISMRESLTEAMTQEAIWSAKVAALDGVREDATKYLDERLLKLYETQDKIFDIEYKLYKLRQDEDDQLEGIFKSLAEQGLINDDIINQYKELMMAEGDVVKLNHEFAKVMGDLTPEQTAWVEQLMNAEKGSDEYNDALQNLQDSGISGLDTIISMDDAQDHLASTIASLSEEMIPLINSLIEVGAVSSKTAKMFYDFIDNMYELAAGETKLGTTTEDVADSFDGVMDVIAQLAMSLIDGEDGAEKLSDVFDELLDLLGLNEMGYEELNDIIGTAYNSTAEFSDEELILAASLKKVSSDLGIYQSGMSGADIATRLNLVATQDLNTAIGILMNKVGDAVGNLSTYKDAMNELAIATKEALAYLHGGIVTIDGVETEVLGLTGAAQALEYYLNNTNFDDIVNGFGLEDLGPDKDDVNSYWDEIVDATEEAAIEIGDAGGDAGDFWYSNFVNNVQGVVSWFSTNILAPIQRGWDKFINGLTNISQGRLPWDSEATGAIIAAQTGTILKKPQMIMAGEAGAEAIVPLEGKNKKYGESILQHILPKYFGMGMQGGGVVGGGLTGSHSDEYYRQALYLIGVELPKASEELKNNILESGKRLGWDLNTYSKVAGGTIVNMFGQAGNEFHNNIDETTKEFTNDMGELIKLVQDATGSWVHGEDSTEKAGTGHTGKAYWTGDGWSPNPNDEVERPKDWDKRRDYNYQKAKQEREAEDKKMQDFINAIIPKWKFPEFQRGGIAKSPTLGMFGEAGAEALIPLEGANKKFGRKMLESIIPDYYPELLQQTGGIFGGNTTTSNISNYGGDEYTENYDINGPITVQAQDPADFVNKLKQTYRTTR